MHNGNWRIFIFRCFNGVGIIVAPLAPVFWYAVRRYARKHGPKAAYKFVRAQRIYKSVKTGYRDFRRKKEIVYYPGNKKSSRPSASARNVRRGGKRTYSKPKVGGYKPAKIPRRGRRCPKGYRFNARLNACIKKK